jgi:ABC-2 type transport system permease protein
VKNHSIFSLIKKEIRSIPKNSVLIFNFCCIVLLVLLIGFIYQKGVLSQIPAAIVDLDQTSTSRGIVQAFAENEKFTVRTAGDYAEVFKSVNEGPATMGIVIPPGLSQEIQRGGAGELLLVINGTNYIVANTAYAKANEILQTINGGISLKVLEGKGFLPGEAEKMVQTVQLEQKILYNPEYNYSYYLTYGIISVGIFSLLMTSIALTLCRQQNKDTGLFSGKQLAVKFMVYGLLAGFITSFIIWMASFIFHLPFRGIYKEYFSLTMPYGFLVAIFALLLLAVAAGEIRIFQASVFFATPLFFVTGFTWPLQSIPEYMRFLYYLCPLTPFVNGIRACLVMGAETSVVSKYIIWQLLLAGLYVPLAWIVYCVRFRKGVIK